MKDKIIVAFDVNNKESFLKLLVELKGEATYIKIGMECFYSLGNEALLMAKEAGLKVFLDLKLHDIPHTVEKSVYALCRLGADMINVHALGGLEMMKAAKMGARKAKEDFNLNSLPKLIAVTHLTSLDQENLKRELGIDRPLHESVLSLAKIAKNAGLDGVVCSAHEASSIKKSFGPDFISVTPGIRLQSGDNQDQKRVMTPRKAIESGASHLVIGRSITQSSSPLASYRKALKEISNES